MLILQNNLDMDNIRNYIIIYDLALSPYSFSDNNFTVENFNKGGGSFMCPPQNMQTSNDRTTTFFLHIDTMNFDQLIDPISAITSTLYW